MNATASSTVDMAFWSVLGIASVLLFFAAVTVLNAAVRGRRPKSGVAAAVLALLLYVEFQSICTFAFPSDHIPGVVEQRMTPVFAGIHPMAFIAVDVLGATVLALLFAEIVRRERRQITPMSIKEAIDDLPMGICCFAEDGTVLMANRAIEDLHRELFGEALTNGAVMGRLAAERAAWASEAPATDGLRMVHTPSGRVWSLTARGITFAGRAARLVEASDVTELFGKSRELEDKRRELDALNRRLTAVNRQVVALAAAKEVVEAKVRIHDEFGETLLAIRQVLADGGEPSAAEVRALADRLRRSLEVLRAGGGREAADEYTLMLDTAENLGVTVEIDGKLPETQPQKHIVATAIHECLTNTIRHARGTHLACTARDEGARFVLAFANDGDVPTEPVTERGGLGTLRTLVENAGGTMEVAVEPRFAIRITLPKEGAHDL